MEKLRLLVTTKCPNKCPMCCNNSWDFSKLPVVEHLIFCWTTKMNLWKVNLFDSIFFLILKSIFLITQTFRYGK